MGRIILAGWLSLGCLSAARAAQPPLALPFVNKASFNEAALQSYALSNQFTAYAGASNDVKSFRGIFTPSTANSKLAIHLAYS